MAFAAPLALMATVASGVVTAASAQAQYGAKARMAEYQAGSDRAMADLAAKNAQWDIGAGFQKSMQAGLVGRAASGRLAVRAGAGNVAGRSLDDLQGSQATITRTNELTQIEDAAHAAYGEQVQGARFTAEAGAKDVEAADAKDAGTLAMLGSIASTTGSVAGKWYDMSATTKNPTGFNTLTG